jgi:formylglycine-generating enzyme required for sulfatase activity
MKSKTNILITAYLAASVCLVLLLGCEEVEPTLEINIAIATVEIPEGTFIMGSPLNEPNRKLDEDEHVVTIAAFRVSTYEITNAEFVNFLNAKEVDRYGYYPEGQALRKNLVRPNTSWGVW